MISKHKHCHPKPKQNKNLKRKEKRRKKKEVGIQQIGRCSSLEDEKCAGSLTTTNKDRVGNPVGKVWLACKTRWLWICRPLRNPALWFSQWLGAVIAGPPCPFFPFQDASPVSLPIHLSTTLRSWASPGRPLHLSIVLGTGDTEESKLGLGPG